VPLVLDASGVARLAERSREAVALLQALRSENLWPAAVPSVALIEFTAAHDGTVNRFLKGCDVVDSAPEALARRAASLRRRARRGSVVDALVVAMAEHGGTVLSAESGDLTALAEHAVGVRVERV